MRVFLALGSQSLILKVRHPTTDIVALVLLLIFWTKGIYLACALRNGCFIENNKVVSWVLSISTNVVASRPISVRNHCISYPIRRNEGLTCTI